MTDRADYYIEKVRYNKARRQILWVSVREDSGKKLSVAHNMARKSMLTLLESGKQFMTIFRNDEGKFRKGKLLSLAMIAGHPYIRTDDKEAAQDQLEDLPEY